MSYHSRVLRLLLIGQMLAAVALAAQTVDGHVVNSANGVDIPGVTVSLIRDGLVAYSATTDSQGHFRIEAVEAGVYTANYAARGFSPIPNFLVDEDFERECGRCFLTERGGQPFPVSAGGDPVHLEVKMPPLGKISGRVLDYLGEPVPDATLQLQWGENWMCKMPTCRGIFRQANTNEKGEYSVTDLDVPGAWLLSAIAPSSWKPPESRDDQQLGWAQTFYPGVTDPQLSERVMVRLGGEISNTDIKLAAVPVHHVRGVVLDLSGNPAPNATVTLSKRIRSPALTRNTENDGTFDFDSVAESEWRLSTKVDQGKPHLRAAQWIQLRLHDLDNLELRPGAPFVIRGKVVLEVPEGVPAPKPPSVTLADASGSPADQPAGAFLTATPDQNGDFQIPNVYPGSYQIFPGPAPPRYYLDSVRLGDYDASRSVEIGSGTQSLTVTYKLGGGTVRGKVENCAGGTVRLLPHNKAAWREGFLLFTPCDSNDRYEITAVRPGEYSVIAIAGNSPIPWYATTWDDGGLLDHASTVTVRLNESSSADLSAIR